MVWVTRPRGVGLSLSIVSRFGLGERDIPDRFEQAPRVEPFEGSELDGLE